MAYAVKVDNRDFKVDVGRSGNKYHVSLDGKSLDAEIINQGSMQATLIIDNEMYDLKMDSDTHIIINGEGFTVQVLDERLLGLMKSESESKQKKEATVFAPMPGLVIEVEVNEGDSVNSGQGLVIVEAMKMQNEMKSPREGIVKKVLVQKGQTVNGKDALIIIE